MFRRFFAVSALALAAVSTPALAGKAATTEIQMTGISAFDPTFTSAKDIQGKVTGQTTTLHSARANVNTAIGVATDAPLATALADLSKKAEKKISVAMEGSMPKLNPDAALPDNVKAAVDSVNGLVEAGNDTVTACTGLKNDATQLVSAIAGFPGQLPSVVKNPMELPKATKIVGDNAKIIGEFPKQIDALVAEVEGIYSDVKSAFGG
jgi:hypothetical protein